MQEELKETQINEMEVMAVDTTISNSLSTLSNSIKRVTSLNLNDEDDQVSLLTALQEVDVRLNDIAGEVLNVTGYYIEERPTEVVDEETGEVKTRNKYITFLFDESGKSYVSGSYSCYKSFVQAISILGAPSKKKVMKFKVAKVPAGTAGHNALKLIYVK